MFSKILIANRGEIACRVIKTAKRLGVKTVAVYSEADVEAMHVHMADEAYCIGPAAASESYLRGDKILAVCEASGAEAVHPGYGFLSENAEFAEACKAKGIVFIGPPTNAIISMGSKSESKRIMEAAGVPLVPGYHGADQDLELLRSEAERIGFPVLVKASAGGGGKGMRVVREASEFDAAVAGARREAKAAFGDDNLLIEKFLDHPRHVEMQVFGDTHGNYVHLYERDCSLQRRHQKVIEEAPAPALPDDVRAKLHDAAVAAARAVDYVGAGTVEFLYQDEAFYFIEMNTRLQVEHPVTEMVTGLDLVEWQLRVASGEPIPLSQDQISVKGHAFEARLYAEDPTRDFLPATGTLGHLRPPTEEGGVRVDTGVREGDAVSIHYDPMIAKLIVWDHDRLSALRKLKGALERYQVVGVATNNAFLTACASHEAFENLELSTNFIDRHRDELIPEAKPADDRILAIAALEVLSTRDAESRAFALASGDPYSPWHATTGWRMNDEGHVDLRFIDGEAEHVVVVHYTRDGYELELSEGRVPARVSRDGHGDLLIDLAGVRQRATVVRLGDELVIMHEGRQHRLTVFDPAAAAGEQEGAGGALTAPMPGKVIDVSVKEGDKVSKGQALVVLEAMKMEHTITAPADGTVAAVHYGPGDQVADGAELLVIERDE
ncbi:acetyl/propionyl/methylcrotonyl-CoA carboxylase subunit alpha [Caenispirillum salinarum]|uniref:acetyl/propionyl/methylcrotonyl-CoA carboxylase subunit alpha n=1 Tax=Caenispirillum salinarum TaxID=859058 RepID=UPI00385109AA